MFFSFLFSLFFFFIIFSNIPILVHIISFVSADCTDAHYLASPIELLNDDEDMLMIITPYYSNIVDYIKNNYKHIIVNVIDENSGDLCLPNVFVYGITSFQQIYPFFYYILFKVKYLIFYGNSDNYLSLVHKDIINYYCVAYMMKCVFLYTNNNNTQLLLDYLENNKNENENLFIITSLPTLNISQFYKSINDYSIINNLNLQFFDLYMNRIKYNNNNLQLLTNIEIYFIESIPLDEYEMILNSYFLSNEINEIIPVVYNIWNCLSSFKEAFEYTVSNIYSLLWTKLRSIFSDYNHINNNNNNFLADNYLYQNIRIVKKNILNNKFESIFQLDSHIFNKISNNMIINNTGKYYYTNKDYFSICEINSQYDSKISNKKGISILLISTMNENNYNKSIYCRVSQLLSITEITVATDKYLIPFFYNAENTSEIEVENILSFIKYLKDNYNITIKHIFGIFANSIYEENILKNEKDIMIWSPLLHTGSDFNNNMYKYLYIYIF